MIVDEAVVAALREKLEVAARLLAADTNMEEARLAVAEALFSVIDLIAPLGCNQQPVNDLIEGLLFLNRGDVLPLFEKAKRSEGGRPRTSVQRGMLQGFALGTVRELMGLRVSQQKARQVVAKVLADAGVKIEGGKREISSRTLQEWDYSALIHPRSTAARALRDFNHLPSNADPERAIFGLLTQLRDLARNSRKKR